MAIECGVSPPTAQKESNEGTPPYGTVWLFHGQGTQRVGMGQELAKNSPLARQIYETADYVLGYPLSEIIFHGPKETLDKTCYTQPATFVDTYVRQRLHMKLICEAHPASLPNCVAGYSSGEYNAFLAAGVFSFEEGLRLVQARAEGMQAACDIIRGGMAAVSGTDEEQIREIIRDCHLVNICVINPGQIVIGGPEVGLESAQEKLRELKISHTPLVVDGAFHSRLMYPAVAYLEAALKEVWIRPARIPIIANTTGRPIRTPREIKDEMIRQLTTPVLWKETIDYLGGKHPKQMVEFGKTAILSKMTVRTLGGSLTPVESGGQKISTVWLPHIVSN